MSIEFEGLENVIDSLTDVGSGAEMVTAIQKACAIVERSAVQKAPKGNGELRRSIQSRVEVVNDDIRGIVYTPLLYAPYVEYGTGLFAEGGNGRKDVPWSYKDDEGEWHTTSGMKPQPYLRPALEENRTRIIEILKEGTT